MLAQVTLLSLWTQWVWTSQGPWAHSWDQVTR